jgi:hypothetical protein
MQTFAVERPTTEELTFNSPENGRERLDDDFNTEKDLDYPADKEIKEDLDLNAVEPITDRLSQDRGGQPHEWQRDTSYAGDEEWHFNGTEIVDASGNSLTKIIEESGNSKYIEQHRDFLRHLTENPDTEYLQQDWIEETAEGKKVIVTVAKMDANGIIRNENWFIVADLEKKEEEEEEQETIENDLDSDLDGSDFEYEHEDEEREPVVVAERVEQKSIAEAIAELFAEDELETEEEQVNNVAAIAKTTLVTQSVVSIAERMKRVAVLFAEPEMSVISEPKPELKSELKPEPKQDEASLKIPETVEVSAAISSSALSPEIISTTQDELQAEVSSKIKVEAQVAEKGISEIEAESPSIVLRQETEESTLVPTSEKKVLVVAPEVKDVAEVPNVALPEIVSEIQEVVADVVEKTNEEKVVPVKDLDTSSDTPFLETSVTDIRSEENANQTRIENLVDLNPELATEEAVEIVVDKTVTESAIDTPVITTTREVIHKEITTEITSEDSKEPVSETKQASEVKEVVALPIKETLVSTKKAEPIGIKLVRIEAGEIARADSPVEARGRVETLEAEASLKGNIIQREILTTQSPESFSRRQYLSYIFPEDMSTTTALREAPANDNHEVTESRATVAARNGIIMRLAA